MGKRIDYLDRLRTCAVFAAVLCAAAGAFSVHHPLRPYVPAPAPDCWAGFDVLYAAGFAMAAPVIFFLSAYFGASSLRMHVIGAYMSAKWRRLGWPWLVSALVLTPELLYLASRTEQAVPLGYACGQSPVFFLALLLLGHLALCAAKSLRRNLFQRRTPKGPSPFVLFAAYAVHVAAAAVMAMAASPLSYVLYCAAACAVYFCLGFYAFRRRWFTDGAYVPSLSWLLPFAAVLVLTHFAGASLDTAASCRPYMTAFLFSFVSLPALFAFLGLSAKRGGPCGRRARTAAALAYPLYVLSDTLVQNTLYLLRPLEAPAVLKLLLALLLAAVYGYMLCRYALFHVPCFAPKG